MKPHIAPTATVARHAGSRIASSTVVVLPTDEVLTVLASDGRPLLEIAAGEKGPEIRLASDDLRIECPGQLNLAAKAITMEATEDVTVRGRTIRLN